MASSVFHLKCDGKAETITVVKFVNASKCGYSYQLENRSYWQKDPSLRSFICNINNKQNFILKKDYNHVQDFHNSNKLSCFGRYTLQLTDNNISNKNG